LAVNDLIKDLVRGARRSFGGIERFDDGSRHGIISFLEWADALLPLYHFQVYGSDARTECGQPLLVI
jgi:hypothetical protein